MATTVGVAAMRVGTAESPATVAMPALAVRVSTAAAARADAAEDLAMAATAATEFLAASAVRAGGVD